MNTLFRTLLVSALALALAACANMPLRQSTTAESAVAPTLAAAPVAQPGVVLPVALSGNPAPTYPQSLLKGRTTGLVEVDCVVDESGNVMVANVLKTSHTAFSKPALDAVRQWKFRPGTRNGVPVAMHVTVPVSFELEP